MPYFLSLPDFISPGFTSHTANPLGTDTIRDNLAFALVPLSEPAPYLHCVEFSGRLYDSYDDLHLPHFKLDSTSLSMPCLLASVALLSPLCGVNISKKSNMLLFMSSNATIPWFPHFLFLISSGQVTIVPMSKVESYVATLVKVVF